MPRPTRRMSAGPFGPGRGGSRCLLRILVAVLLAAVIGPVHAGAAGRPPRKHPAEILAAHNAWARSIEHVWSRADLSIVLPSSEPGGQPESYELEGHLMVRKPERLFVHGRASVMGEAFSLGMNERQYWLWIGMKVNTVWVGSSRLAEEQRMLFSPRALAKALGLFAVELTGEDWARFGASRSHYLLTYVKSYERRGSHVTRMWLDRTTLRPARVEVFDRRGARLMEAEMLRYESAGAAEVCTSYRINFAHPEPASMYLRLSAVSLSKEPKDRVFEYRRPPGAEEVDLDRPPPQEERAATPGT